MSLRGQDGQATVEFALVLPLLGLMMLAVVQIGVIVDAQVRATHAAREGARAAAVGDSAEQASSRALGGRPLLVDVGAEGQVVTVTVRVQQATTVPLVGRLFGDVELTAEASMRLEAEQ